MFGDKCELWEYRGPGALPLGMEFQGVKPLVMVSLTGQRTGLRGNASKPKRICISKMTPTRHFSRQNIRITLWWYRRQLCPKIIIFGIDFGVTDFQPHSFLYKWNENVQRKWFNSHIYWKLFINNSLSHQTQINKTLLVFQI